MRAMFIKKKYCLVDLNQRLGPMRATMSVSPKSQDSDRTYLTGMANIDTTLFFEKAPMRDLINVSRDVWFKPHIDTNEIQFRSKECIISLNK